MLMMPVNNKNYILINKNVFVKIVKFKKIALFTFKKCTACPFRAAFYKLMFVTHRYSMIH